MGNLDSRGVPKRLEGIPITDAVKRDLRGILELSRDCLGDEVREYSDELCYEILKVVGVSSLNNGFEVKYSTACATNGVFDELVGFEGVLYRLLSRLEKEKAGSGSRELSIESLDYLYEYYVECLRLRLLNFNKEVLKPIYFEEIPRIVDSSGRRGHSLPDFDEEIWINPDMGISEYNERRYELEDALENVREIDNNWYEAPYYSDSDVDLINEYEDFIEGTSVISEDYEEYEDVAVSDLPWLLRDVFYDDIKNYKDEKREWLVYKELLEEGSVLIPLDDLLEKGVLYKGSVIDYSSKETGLNIDLDGEVVEMTPAELYSLWVYTTKIVPYLSGR